MNIAEFETLLNNTIIPSSLSMTEREEKLEPLNSFLAKNLPHKLYKYRCCCENHISAFDVDQIWASSTLNMNDGFDSRLYFNRQNVMEKYKAETSPEQIEHFIDILRENELLQKQISLMPGGRNALSNIVLPKELIKDGMETSRNKLADIIEEMCETLYAITQQTMRICSFSKSIKSAYMWGQYSDDEKGFCIEYDFCSASDYYKTVENKMAFGVFYPVIYSAERYSVTDDYIGYLIQYRLHFYNAMNSREFANVRDIQNYINTFLVCPDLCVATKIALYKSIEWQYEKEWRLILDIVNEPLSNQADHLCIIKRPSAIYLGRRISSLNEKILKRLAEEKRIPVYKMRLDDASPSYRLIPEPV